MQEFRIKVADLTIGAVARNPRLQFFLDKALEKFALRGSAPDGLVFDVVIEDSAGFSPERVLYESPTAYAIGLAADGSYRLRSRVKPGPALFARLDADFQRGVVQVPAAAIDGRQAIYPLKDFDILVTMIRLAQTGDCLVHSAAIANDGVGYLFVGPSGVGKSTMCDLWQQEPGVEILGEDVNVLRLSQDGLFWIYGAPWHLDPDRCSPAGVPLRAVFLVSHGTRNQAMMVNGAGAVGSILGNCVLPLYDRDGLAAILSNLDMLSQSIPVIDLAYQPGVAIIDYVKEVVEG